MKYIMTQAVCEEGLAELGNDVDVYIANNQDPNNYLDEMKDADALIVRIAKCDRNAIEASKELKVIGRTGVGFDSVDVKAATERGIPVVITPGANTNAVAEHAVALMFAISKNLYEGQMEIYNGNFDEVRGLKKAFELKGKKIGFIGMGAIGKETQIFCKAIGMKTAGYDPFMLEEEFKEIECEQYDDYQKLLSDCDIISIHVPLIKETKNMISMEQLKKMKKTSVIINCSRGGVINEIDLAQALNDGIIAGAGTDVFTEEPPSKDNPLLNAKNIILSPHSAAQTREAVINMAVMCVKGCQEVLKGNQWPYVADPSVYDHPRWKKQNR